MKFNVGLAIFCRRMKISFKPQKFARRPLRLSVLRRIADSSVELNLSL
ncbi:MAG: hypothetical protein SR1Q7_09485 [Quinella sp. 1Q7]|nr:hypothetical protein [Quinella sp. 1Q7]